MKEKSLLKTDLLVLLGLRRRRRARDWPGPSYLRMAKKRRALIAVTSQLETLVRCNSPLVYGLQMAAIDTPDANVASVLLGLRDDLASGSRLWESMARLNRFFPRYYVDLVKVGEETGSLGRTLADLCDLQARLLSFRDASMAWVAFHAPFVLLSNLLIVLFMAIYVFPEFIAVMKEFGGEPPALAAWMVFLVEDMPEMGDSASLVLWLLPVFVIGLGVLLWAATASNRRAMARLLSPIGMCIPGLRRLIIYANLGHIAIVLERMLSAGIPLDRALASTAQLDLNAVFARKLDRFRVRVQQGETLSDAMVAEGGLPGSFAALVSIGEKAGLLEESLRKLAAHYSRQTTKTVRIMANTLGPLCVLVLGVLVLAINVTAFTILISLSDAMIDSM